MAPAIAETTTIPARSTSAGRAVRVTLAPAMAAMEPPAHPRAATLSSVTSDRSSWTAMKPANRIAPTGNQESTGSNGRLLERTASAATSSADVATATFTPNAWPSSTSSAMRATVTAARAARIAAR
jgi:hypothetical protein